MKNINKKEYCILGLESVDGMKDEIISIAIGSPKFIENEHMLMSVFETYLEPSDMREVFDSTRKSYFLFELDPKSALVNILDKKMYNFVFKNYRAKEEINDMNTSTDLPDGLIKTIFNSTMGINISPINDIGNLTDDKLRDIINNLNNFKGSDGKSDNSRLFRTGSGKKEKPTTGYNKDVISKYSESDRHNLINEILNKGSNLTDDDKHILKFLTNKNN